MSAVTFFMPGAQPPQTGSRRATGGPAKTALIRG
jgi:hypothetical protein